MKKTIIHIAAFFVIACGYGQLAWVSNTIIELEADDTMVISTYDTINKTKQSSRYEIVDVFVPKHSPEIMKIGTDTYYINRVVFATNKDKALAFTEWKQEQNPKKKYLTVRYINN